MRPPSSCSRRCSACGADGVARFFERMLEDQPGDAAALIGIWSSHPPTAERIAATRRPATGKPAFTEANGTALPPGLRRAPDAADKSSGKPM
jgi:predicted Zn-dependent protease